LLALQADGRPGGRVKPGQLGQDIGPFQAKPHTARCVPVDPSQRGSFSVAQRWGLSQDGLHLRFTGYAAFARTGVGFAGANLVHGLAGNAKPTRNRGAWLSAGADGSNGFGGQVSSHDAITSSG
jgi:hypothetical protein